MSDFGNILTICSLDAFLILSKICVNLMNASITTELIGMFVSSMRYGIPSIFRYDFD